MDAADSSPLARRGKIARLPHALREEVNRRIRDGQPGTQILPWLNARKEAREVCAAQFGGEDISDANLSGWRQGGYQDWLRDQNRADEARALAETSMAIARASGGNTAEGVVAVLAGQILQGLELMTPEERDAAVLQVSRLRKVELEGRRIKALETRVGMEELKVQAQTVELFLDWYANRAAAEIVEDKHTDRADKAKALRKLMFGERPAANSELQTPNSSSS